MNIYKLISDSKNYSNVIDESTLDNDIKNRAMDQFWKPFEENNFDIPALNLSKSDTGKLNFKSDIFWGVSPFYVFSEKAVEALRDILESRGQFLPVNIKSKRKNFIAYYPTNVIENALDKHLSSYVEIGHGYGVVLNKTCLVEDKLKGEYLFVLSECRYEVFVTDKFKKRVEEAGLVGFDFTHKVRTV